MPIPEYNADQWKDTWRETDPRAWAKEYDRAFRVDRKTFNWPKVQQGGNVPITDVHQWALERLGQVESVLDVACGPGYFGLAVAGQGIDFFAVDISPECIAFAQKHVGGALKKNFKVMAVEDLDEIGQTYDVVTSFELLEHVKDPEAALIKMWDRVKPGGRLILTTPVENRVPSPYHIHSFSEYEMEQLIGKVLGRHVPFHLVQIGGVRWGLEVTNVERDLNYVQVAVNNKDAEMASQSMAKPDNLKSGFWNWVRALDGEIKTIKDIERNIDRYDVIHCQIAGVTMGGIRRLAANKKPHQQLVAQIDYSVETWSNLGQDMSMILDTLSLADRIVSVEPLGANILAQRLGREVFVMPHPYPVEGLKKARVPIEQRWGLLVHSHRDSDWFTPVWATEEIDKTILGGYQGQESSPAFVALVELYYDWVWPIMDGDQYVRQMAGRKVCFDAYRHHVFGRTVAEGAALGIPTVGYKTSYAMQQFFPDLRVEVGDVMAAREKIQRLYTDEQFYHEVVNYAEDEVDRIDLKESAQRFRHMLKGDGFVYTRQGYSQRVAGARQEAEGQVDLPQGAVGRVSDVPEPGQPLRGGGASEDRRERGPILPAPGSPRLARVESGGHAPAGTGGAARHFRGPGKRAKGYTESGAE